MALWYYYDNDGQKKGPYSGGQLRWFARQGTITPESIIENDEGKTVSAKEVNGLTFSEVIRPETRPPVEANPFTAAIPAAPSPFTAPLPPRVAQGKEGAATKTILRTFKTVVVLLILAVVGGSTGPILWESYNLKKNANELISEDVLAPQPLKLPPIALLSVQWDTPTSFEVVKFFWSNIVGSEDETVYASGKFTVKTQTAEKLYNSVGLKDGLQELGIIVLYEKELDVAMRKYRELPMAYQNGLQIPGDLSQIRFYGVLAPENKEVTLTGSIDLTKDGNEDWRKDDIQVEPFLEEFTAESKLRDAYKLDDPATKSAVETIVQARKEFVDKVDKAYDDWTFKKAAEEGIKKEIRDRPLAITDISATWTDKTTDTASGKFTVKTVTTEQLYQSVDKKVALGDLGINILYEREVEELGIAEIFNKVVYEENILIPSEFFKVLLPSGSEVTLTGSIEQSKSENGFWQASKVQFDPMPIPDFVTESKLRNSPKKLDDPNTSKVVEERIERLVKYAEKLIKQKDDFDNFCKDKIHTGSLEVRGPHNAVTYTVRVEFNKPGDPNAKEVNGTILIHSPGWKGARSFSVTNDIANETVAGEIDNKGLPSQGAFLESAKDYIKNPADRDDAIYYFGLLRDNRKIEIKFENKKIQFFITDRDGGNRHEIEKLTGGRSTPKTTQKDDRNWLLPIIKEKTPRPSDPWVNPAPIDPDPKRILPSPLGVSLSKAIQDSGLGNSYAPLDDFTRYGSASLRDQLKEAQKNYDHIDPLEVARKREALKALDGIKAKILAAQNEIAQKTFFYDYTYETDEKSVIVHGDTSSFTMRIASQTGFSNLKAEGVSLPEPNVTCNMANQSWSTIELSLRGNTDSIRLLARNNDNYRVRVWLKNLRFGNRKDSCNNFADVQKIDVVKVQGGVDR